jgi:hypothetical protein
VEFIKKRDPSTAAARMPSDAGVELVDRDKTPALVEFLTTDVWPDGTARRPGTVLLFCDDYRIKACLSDRDQGLVLFLTCEGLFCALDACEEALRDPRADWRAAKKDHPRRSGRGA